MDHGRRISGPRARHGHGRRLRRHLPRESHDLRRVPEGLLRRTRTACADGCGWRVRPGDLPQRRRLRLRRVPPDQGSGADASLRTGLQRLPHRVVQRRSEAPDPGDGGALLGRRCLGRGDRALRAARPPGGARLQSTPGLGTASATPEALGSGLGCRAGPRSLRELSHRWRLVRRHGDRRHRQWHQGHLRAALLRPVHRQLEADRRRDLRRRVPPLPEARLRLRRKRRGLDRERARGHGLAVAATAALPRSIPSTTCCRPSISSDRSTAVSGSKRARCAPRSSASRTT